MREKTSAQGGDTAIEHVEDHQGLPIRAGRIVACDRRRKACRHGRACEHAKKRTETKYLIKWADLAYIHCTWETDTISRPRR